ncbi:MAG TPA: MlaD family protein, partial [Nocardioidaceae bacterium]|nr:MlaD family protein [Nocardioidaceae bacterium]
MNLAMHKSFRERNLTTVALVTVVGFILAIIASFQLANLPIISGSRFHAIFAESGGLKLGDPVQVAGVTVGAVKGVELDGAVVDVTFTAKGVELGDQTTAMIKTGTLLGARFLELSPRGDGSLDAGGEIPLERTKAPYNLSDSLTQIAGHTQKLDLDMVAKAMRTFSATFRDTSDELGPALEGVAALSKTINS